MVTIEEACKVIQKAIPKTNRIIACSDLKDNYLFEVVPRRWNGDIHDYPCGGLSEYVEKNSGEYKTMDATSFLDILLAETKQPDELNILPYLSKEDAEFAAKVQKDREMERVS